MASKKRFQVEPQLDGRYCVVDTSLGQYVDRNGVGRTAYDEKTAETVAASWNAVVDRIAKNTARMTETVGVAA